MNDVPSWHPQHPTQRNATTFKAGHKGGRPKGVKDRISSDLKKSFIEALRSFGSDGQGTDGIEGFIHYAIRNDLSGVLRVVAKIIPLQVNADVQGKNIANVIINTVPPNHFVKDGVIINGEVISDGHGRSGEPRERLTQFDPGG
jgi:hypothetical protein